MATLADIVVKEEDPIKGSDSIKTADLRRTLNVSSSTMSLILKKKGFKGRNLNGAQARNILIDRGFNFPSKTKIIAMLIYKGGTGKTTSTKFLSERLSSYGCKVLMIDADPQANLTKSFKLEDYDIRLDPETPILADLFDKNSDVTIEDSIYPLTENLHLLPSTPVNSRCDTYLRGYKNATKPLEEILRKSNTGYDYIIFDCGPSLSLTNTAVIGAADEILMPVNPDDFSLHGIDETLSDIKETIQDCSINRDIGIKLFLTKYDEREFLSIDVLAEIRKKYKESVLRNIIRTSSDPKNCIRDDEDLFSLANSRAKEDYDGLAKELLGFET